jgi:hypothetical protein
MTQGETNQKVKADTPTHPQNKETGPPAFIALINEAAIAPQQFKIAKHNPNNERSEKDRLNSYSISASDGGKGSTSLYPIASNRARSSLTSKSSFCSVLDNAGCLPSPLAIFSILAILCGIHSYRLQCRFRDVCLALIYGKDKGKPIVIGGQ